MEILLTSGSTQQYELIKKPGLVELIQNTPSLNADERDYWLEILPTLSDEYADKLFDILDEERKKFYNEYIIKKNGENNWTINVL